MITTDAMSFYAIDTLQFSKRMQKAGLNKEVSEELAEALKENHSQSLEGLATRQDLKSLETKLEQKIDSLEQRIDLKLDSLTNKLIIRMFIAMTAAIAIVSFLDRIIIDG